MTAKRSGRQLVFDLPPLTALGRDDFLVTPANAGAVAMIERYPDWPHFGAVIVGPPGSGKSHLLEVWREQAAAAVVSARDITSVPPDIFAKAGALAIDDAPGEHLDERALFHLLNLARQSQGHVLIAATTDPVSWKVALPDLVTRLKALPVARLDAPDDALLRGVLVKLFADRQLAVEEAVVSYLMLRMPRSLDAARAIVAELDRLALTEKSAVTRSLAARVLEAFTEPGMFGDEA